MKKVISVLLVLSMLLCFAACDKEKTDQETNATNIAPETEDTEPEFVETEKEISYEKVDLGDMTVRLRYFGNADYEKYDVLGENGGDSLADAVYKRNLAVEENLNMRFEWIKGSDDWLGYPAEVEQLILAGDDAFDIGFMELQKSLPQAVAGYYKDLKNSSVINADDPWWYSELMRETQVNDRHLYYTSGAFSLTTLLKAGAVLFNKDIWKANYGDTGKLYDMVRDETWTMEAMQRISHEIYRDTNGDGALDGGDVYGFCFDWQMINYFVLSSGLSFSSRSAEGDPVLNMYNEDVLKLVDVIYAMVSDGKTSYRNDGTVSGVSAFKNQNALFYNKFLLHGMTQLRETDFEWGVLPPPALYEKSGYTSANSTVSGNCAFIPITSSEKLFETYATVLNAMAVESYLTVVPECGTALRSKYSDEPADAEMIDIIYKTINAPFIMAATIPLDDIVGLFQNIFNGMDSGEYTSFWKSNESKYEALLKDLIENAK